MLPSRTNTNIKNLIKNKNKHEKKLSQNQLALDQESLLLLGPTTDLLNENNKCKAEKGSIGRAGSAARAGCVIRICVSVNVMEVS